MHKLKKLLKHKSKILKNIPIIYKRHLDFTVQEIARLKSFLNNINILIKKEFNTTISNYWINIITNISVKDSHNMFPEINKLFRKKHTEDIKKLHIDPQQLNILINSQIDNNKLNKTNSNKYIISDKEEIFKILGTHLKNTHEVTVLSNNNFHRAIIQKVKIFKDTRKQKQRNNETITVFSPTNIFLNTLNRNNFFTNYIDLFDRFRNLNNKSSTGIYGTSNIMLKNLSTKLIEKYVILFNNELN